MEYGICLHSVIAVRSEPSHRAEMVTQVLFGELFRISEFREQWVYVQLLYDGYEGWVHQLQVQTLANEVFLDLQHKVTPVTLELVQLVVNEKTSGMTPILLGSSLPGYAGGRIEIAGNGYLYDGACSEIPSGDTVSVPNDEEKIRFHLRENSLLFLNSPYLWGGRSPFGLDCSGFIQILFKLQHIQLLRDAAQQATQGEVIGLPFEALTGDVAFFENEEGQICHVGMILEPNMIIHCSGKVRIDHFDQEGIFNRETGKYTHRLRLIKRMY